MQWRKRGNADGITKSANDYSKHACSQLIAFISLLFDGLLAREGTLPTCMVTSAMIPIPKGRSAQ